MAVRCGRGFHHEQGVPALERVLFNITKKIGTKISTWMVEVIMPPTMGTAIGSSHRIRCLFPKELCVRVRTPWR
jgi:hypothetical protein